MNWDRAVELTEACTRLGMAATVGLFLEKPDDRKAVSEAFKTFQSASLADLVEANRIVREADRTDNGDGTKSKPMNCDDRLTAALYAMFQFNPTPASPAESVIDLGGRALFVIRNDATHLDDGVETPCMSWRELTAACRDTLMVAVPR